MAFSPITYDKQMGKQWKQWQTLFSWAPKSLQMVKMLAPWGKKSYEKPRQHNKKQRHHFADKGPNSQSYGFSSSHVQMWELDYKKAECRRIDAFELWCWRRLLRVPWTARRSNQSILKRLCMAKPIQYCKVISLQLK